MSCSIVDSEKGTNKRTKKARVANSVTNCVCIIKKSDEEQPKFDDDLDF